MVTWLPRESATTPSRRSISARFCPYWPNSVEARRLSSKVSMVCVVAVSFTSLAAGTIPLSVGKLRNASGSNGDAGFCLDSRLAREHAKQAVGSDIRDGHRHHRADHIPSRHHLNRLKIWRAAGDLARETARPFHQHIEGEAAAPRVEGSSVAVDRSLQAREAVGLHLIGNLIAHRGAGCAGARRILERKR